MKTSEYLLFIIILMSYVIRWRKVLLIIPYDENVVHSMEVIKLFIILSRDSVVGLLYFAN